MTSEKQSWRYAYSILGAYILCLIAFVEFSPLQYSAKLPASIAFSAYSQQDFPAGFAIDLMWVIFPLFLIAFTFAAPSNQKFHSKAYARFLSLFLVFVLTPFFVYFGTLNTSFEFSQTTSLGRVTAHAAVSKIWFIWFWGFYFCFLVIFAWHAYIVTLKAFFKHDGESIDQERILAKFDQVAEQIEKGDISKEEADARGEEIMQELRSQTISSVYLQIQQEKEKHNSQIVYRLAAFVAFLAAIFLASRFLS
jgi:FlaA1/EpsC-like NDP-sugar epimerase